MELSDRFEARSLATLLALVASLALLAGPPAAASAAPIELGVYQCPASPAYTACDPSNATALDEYRSQLGRYPDISLSYRKLEEPLLSPDEMTDLSARGVKPLVTVEPYGKNLSMRAIAAGTYDSQIHAAASVARGFGAELLLRFAHEMNGNWYPWGSGGGSTAQDYVDAWRRYVSIFREDGATNVKFVWAPNIDGGSYPFAPYFPGDSWVDYVALDGYNWGNSAWLDFSQTFAASYDALTQLSGRPVMITETGSSEVGGDKAAWIRDAFFKAIPQRFPRIVAVTWFNRDFSGAGEQDWRISSSSASLAAYREVVSNSLYGGSDPAPTFTEPAPEPAPAPPKQSSPRKTGKAATVKALRIEAPRAAREETGGTETVAAAPRRILRAKVVYRVSEPVPVRILVFAAGHGKPASSVTVARRSGSGSVPLSKLVRRRALRRGAYRVEARAIDGGSAGPRSRRARFRVL